MAFESLTDERIEQLLKLQKRITNPTAILRALKHRLTIRSCSDEL